jgi:uncharacterized membrane protein YhaH (DUF805 family)
MPTLYISLCVFLFLSLRPSRALRDLFFSRKGRQDRKEDAAVQRQGERRTCYDLKKAMSTDLSESERPGIDRLNYFLSMVAVGFTASAAMLFFGPGSSLAKVVGLILTVIGFLLDVMRLRNIGVSQWFAMLRFVPFFNLVYSIVLVSAQAGWAETRCFDRSGRTIASFLVLLYLTMFILFSIAGTAKLLSLPFWL